MGSITYETGYEKFSLEVFTNPHLCKFRGITEDIAACVLPLFLEKADLCSLAFANKEWAKVTRKHFDVLTGWKKHDFLKNLIQALPPKDLPFKVVVLIFISTLEDSKPLAKRLGYAIKNLSFEDFPDFIADLNLVAFCEELNNKPLKDQKETLHQYAEKLRTWIKNTPAFANLSFLNLTHKNLTILPKEIGFFTGLQHLELQDTQLLTLPDSIGNLTALRVLILSNNQLQSLPASIGNLKYLYVLDLDDNNLQSLPNSIGDLQHLWHFSLSGNKLRALPNSFEKLTKLTVLSLSKNQLCRLPESIGNLVKLMKLNLSNNQLVALPNSIGNLKELSELDLWNNKIKSLPRSSKNLKNALIYVSGPVKGPKSLLIIRTDIESPRRCTLL